jgi:phosphotransferase system HPr (HPr) family protein
MRKSEVTITNEEGLHARPANLFSKEALRFKSDIYMTKNGGDKHYNPKRIISLLSMGVVKGDRLNIVAEGDDEAEAVSKLGKVINSL